MNQVKMTNAKELVAKDSTIASSETNDCVVYATAAAFGIPYDAAHIVTQRVFGRKPRKGVSSSKMTKELMDMASSPYTINGKTVGNFFFRPKTTYHTYGMEVPRSMTVSTFIKKHPQGNYLILVRGHALAVRDGVMIDNVNRGSARKPVMWAFEIK